MSKSDEIVVIAEDGRGDLEPSVHARATLEIELSGLGSWGRDYSMSQIIDQARESALGAVRKGFKDERVRVNSVKITAVYAREKGL